MKIIGCREELFKTGLVQAHYVSNCTSLLIRDRQQTAPILNPERVAYLFFHNSLAVLNENTSFGHNYLGGSHNGHLKKSLEITAASVSKPFRSPTYNHRQLPAHRKRVPV